MFYFPVSTRNLLYIFYPRKKLIQPLILFPRLQKHPRRIPRMSVLFVHNGIEFAWIPKRLRFVIKILRTGIGDQTIVPALY